MYLIFSVMVCIFLIPGHLHILFPLYSQQRCEEEPEKCLYREESTSWRSQYNTGYLTHSEIDTFSVNKINKFIKNEKFMYRPKVFTD